MQQQETECESQENTQPDSQVNTSNEVIPEISPVEDVENITNDIELDHPISTTEGESEIEKEENSNNEDSASDSPLARLKTARKSSKKRSSKKEKELESSEPILQTELKNDSEIVITEMNEGEVTLTSEVTENKEEDEHITVDEPDETNTLDTCIESGQIECNELPDDDDEEVEVEVVEEEEEKSEGSQGGIVEEETSVTGSVSYEEISQPKSRHSEESEMYSISVSCEYDPLNSRFNGKEKDEPSSYEEPVSSDYISVSGGSCGGNIRSISARRPVRRSGLVTPERSSVSVDRFRTDGNHSDSDYSTGSRGGGAFSSLKRKAFDNVTINLKKQKLNDSMNYKFFSMVSSPLRLLKNKLSDRIVESPNAHRAEDIANGNNDDNESLDEKIKEEAPEFSEKAQSIMTTKIDNQNMPLYQSWCNLM